MAGPSPTFQIRGRKESKSAPAPTEVERLGRADGRRMSTHPGDEAVDAAELASLSLEPSPEQAGTEAGADLASADGPLGLTPWRAVRSANTTDSSAAGDRLLRRTGRDRFGPLAAGLHCAALAGVWVAVLPFVPFAVLVASLVPKGRKLHKPAVAGRA